MGTRGRRLAVGIVDVGLIIGVLAWGLQIHGVDAFSTPSHLLMTTGPFLAGWLVAAPVIGTYGDHALAHPRRGLLITGGAWVIASVIGAAIRATPYVDGGAPLIFVAVVLGVGAMALLPWRLLVAVSARA